MNTLFKSALSLALLMPVLARGQDVFEAPPINYSETTPENPVERLRADLETGSATLSPDDSGQLRPLLTLLGIPEASQVLVFSKTSLQINHISPTAPRAIYFNDDIYVGAVQNSEVIEISTADPKLGTVFYTVTPGAGGRPELKRQRHDCLQCHGGTMTRNLPGHIVRSVFPAEDGQPIMKAGSTLTDHTTPLEERWGGWYITGTHGEARHRGNQIAVESAYDATIDMDAGANQSTLPPRVDVTNYLTPHSDIVAMMVLEHQAQMHNLMTRAAFETRMALHRQAVMDQLFERDPDALSESSQRIVTSVSDALVEYMLFMEEPELDSPIRGTSGFAEEFAAEAPRDSQGRSLKDFDLETRLFKYPLSYLIYSPQFDGMPDHVKKHVYQRLWNILTGAEATPDLLYLTNATSRAIREILIETKPGLPDYWVK